MIGNLKMIRAVLVGGMLLAAGGAQAHYLWLEKDEGGIRVYYGEAEGGLREKSPGKLDAMGLPRAFQPEGGGRGTPLSVSRGTGHFAVAGGDEAAVVLVTEESAGVRDLGKFGLGLAKSNYYARYGQPRDRTAATDLMLDVAGHEPNRLTVFYRGRPLKDAKVEVVAPNTWVQEHKTDAEGNVLINTPWRGHYVVHVLHIDPTPGTFEGKRYDALRNHFTYSFRLAEGADPGPAVPPRQGTD